MNWLHNETGLTPELYPLVWCRQTLFVCFCFFPFAMFLGVPAVFFYFIFCIL